MPPALTRLTALTRHLLPAARAPTARPQPLRRAAVRAMASLDKATPATKWKELLSPEEVRRKMRGWRACARVDVRGGCEAGTTRASAHEERRKKRDPQKKKSRADVARPT
jgi:hypothetical protein